MFPVMPALPEAHQEFDAIVRAYAGMVQGALRQLGVDPAMLDDAAQDVFVVLFRRFSEYDSGRSLASWLWGIARGVASTHRRGRRRRHRLTEAVAREPGADSARPDDAAALGQARRMLAEFLASLDEDKCAVFVLAEIEGRTGPEIAAQLQVNLNTVYARLRAARQRFDTTVQSHRSRAAKLAGAVWGFRWGVQAKVLTASLSSVLAAALVVPAALDEVRSGPVTASTNAAAPMHVPARVEASSTPRSRIAGAPAKVQVEKAEPDMKNPIATLALSAVLSPAVATSVVSDVHAAPVETSKGNPTSDPDLDSDGAALLDGTAETREYIFGDEILDGDVNRPEGSQLSSRARVRHQSLIRIRGHFIRELVVLGNDL